jgi:hypothetical protein
VYVPADTDNSVTLFFILGCLDEYGGRQIIENGNSVERFYAGERTIANIFHTYLQKLATEQQLDSSIDVEVDQSGGIVFYSAPLTALIDDCYIFDFSTSGYVSDGSESRRADAYISMQVFKPVNRRAKLSFLAGAYVRFGEKSVFRFANARHKAELVRELLTELGCTNVELIHSNPGYIPAVFDVVFEPSDEIRDWFAGGTHGNK